MNITEQLQQNIDDAAAKGLYDLYTIYDVREPLLNAIQTGEGYILRSELIRSLIVSEMKKSKRANRKPKSLDIEQRNFKILCELHYLNGQGVTVYGDSKKLTQTGCEILAAKYHLSPDSIKDLWKNKTPHPLYNVAFKAGQTV